MVQVQHRKWCLLILAAFAGTLLNPSVPGFCAESSTPIVLQGRAEVDDQMASILSEELEIERFAAQYDQASNIADFAKGRRQWSYNFGNAVCTEGGLIAATALFASNTGNRHAIQFSTGKDGQPTTKYVTIAPAIDPNSVNGTITPQIVGQCISIAGGSFELLTTLGVVISRDRLGLSPKALDRAVLHHLDSIDNKLKIASSNAVSNESVATELQVLKELRDRAISDYYAARLVEKRWTTWNNCQNVTGIIRNTVGCIGNSINELGRHEARRRLNGDGSILNFISASIMLVRPYFCEVWARYRMRNLEHRLAHLRSRIDSPNEGKLEENVTSLAIATNKVDRSSSLNKRLQIYADFANDHTAIFDHQEKRMSVLSCRSSVRGTLYAPTKQTQSMINIVTQFRPRNNQAENNRYGFVANLTYTSGQLFNISELSRQRVVDEVAHYREERAQILPTQLLAKRISLLSQDIKGLSPP